MAIALEEARARREAVRRVAKQAAAHKQRVLLLTSSDQEVVKRILALNIESRLLLQTDELAQGGAGDADLLDRC